MTDKLIVALDFPDFESSCKMVEILGDEVGFYKIGLEMLASGDYFKMIEFLKKRNKKVFADLKFYDIGATVGRAVANLAKYDVDLLTIHSANFEIMRAAALAKGAMKVVAVTVLTCLDEKDLREMGFGAEFSLQELVLKKAALALESKLDGVVASALECELLRKKFGDNFLVITPGIRLEFDKKDDQKRVCDAASALRFKASNLVVGRPITHSENPKKTAQEFNKIIRSV